jgi:TPR repeat protein
VQLAEMYNQGRGVPRNDAEAARLYRRGAEAGDAEAQYFLAMVFFTGRGVAASEDSAMTWLRRSAEKGYAPAVAELARRAN